MSLNKDFDRLPSMEIAKRIKIERDRRGLSVRALGKLLGVSGSAVSQWESGGNITWENRLGLSNELNIPIVDFLPPKMAEGEFKVRNPEERLLVERFRRLPRTLREFYLGMLIAQTEGLEDPPPSDETEPPQTP